MSDKVSLCTRITPRFRELYFRSGCGYSMSTILDVMLFGLGEDYRYLSVRGRFPENSLADAFMRYLSKYKGELDL